MLTVKWTCAQCGATGEVSYGDTDNTFEVAGKVITDHNATAITGCHRRPDSLVSMGEDPVVIEREP